MNILLVNDDGYNAPGMQALVGVVKKYTDDFIVVAPHIENSGKSQAITVHEPLRMIEKPHGYMLNGTPADCTKMALQGLGLKPDFVISGINLGSNLGTDTLYSGTVGAALEAAILGVPAVAFSLCGSQAYFPTAAKVVEDLVFKRESFLELIPKGGVLNINIPALDYEEIKGVRLAHLGVQEYEGLFERREDPRGGHYYWMGGRQIPVGKKEVECDLALVEQGYVAITPLTFDLTNQEALAHLAPLFE